jgi:hypothetical protein
LTALLPLAAQGVLRGWAEARAGIARELATARRTAAAAARAGGLRGGPQQYEVPNLLRTLRSTDRVRTAMWMACQLGVPRSTPVPPGSVKPQ